MQPIQRFVPSKTQPSHSKKAQRGPALALAFGLALTGMSLALGLPVAAQSLNAQRQYTLARTITVTGQSSEKIPATLADVQLGVEAQGKTAQSVQQEVANRSAAVVALLKGRSVQNLKTTGINLSPQYSYNNGKQTLTGYQASNIVSFRVPTEQAGLIIDAAVQAGASRIDSVSFTASEQAISDAQKLALRKAAKSAQDQAASVLSALGLSPKEIVNIQLDNANAPAPVPYPLAQKAMESRVASAPTPVEGGDQSVQASVTLQISY